MLEAPSECTWEPGLDCLAPAAEAVISVGSEKVVVVSNKVTKADKRMKSKLVMPATSWPGRFSILCARALPGRNEKRALTNIPHENEFQLRLCGNCGARDY